MVANGMVMIPLGLLLIWAVISWLYLKFYNRNINNLFNTGKVLKLISPSYVSVFLLIILLITNYFITAAKTAALSREYLEAAGKEYRVWNESDNSLENLGNHDYLQVYSIEENPGYIKNTYIQNDFECTLFTSAGWHDGMHPDAILYTDHTDKTECKAILTIVSFETDNGEMLTQFSTIRNNDRYNMLLLAAGAPCKAVITYGFMDEKSLEEYTKQLTDGKNPVSDDLFIKKEIFTVDLSKGFGY